MNNATKVYCPSVWEGALYLTLPPLMSKGELLWLEFTEPDRGRIVGAFEIMEVIYLYTSRTGYSALLIVKPSDDQTSPLERQEKG